MKQWLGRRHNMSSYSVVFQEPTTEDEESFANFTRINTHLFQRLLCIKDPLIKKQDTNMRDCKSSCARLEATPPLTMVMKRNNYSL